MSVDFLYPVFEEQLTVEHDPYTNKITIGVTPFSANEILKGDRNAYRDEFSRWFDDIWLPYQLDLLDQILSIPGNKRRYEDLCLALNNGDLIPLVGSGMSAPSGLPLWSEFLSEVRKYSSLTEEDLESFFYESKFEEAAEAIAESMPDRLFDERIEHDLRFADADVVRGSISFLPMLFDRLVITTNLDNVLEHVYQKHDLPFSEVLTGRRIRWYRRLKVQSDRMLIKLHGDCKSREERILSVAEYEESYAPGEPIFEELSGIYRNQSILCLGCSMNGDRTVKLLGEVAEMDEAMPKHYAFLKHPDDEATRLAREHFLTAHDVFPIWFKDDHDQSITALLVGLARHKGAI